MSTIKQPVKHNWPDRSHTGPTTTGGGGGDHLTPPRRYRKLIHYNSTYLFKKILSVWYNYLDTLGTKITWDRYIYPRYRIHLYMTFCYRSELSLRPNWWCSLIPDDRSVHLLAGVQEHIFNFYQGGRIDHCTHVPSQFYQYSVENEYNAACTAVLDLEHLSILKNQLMNKDPDVVPEKAHLVILVRKSYFHIYNNGKYTKHTRHISIIIHFVRNN